jgi:signal transduction histidine kinase
VSRSFARQSQRSLGIGRLGAAVVLTAGLMIPVVTAIVTLRWTLLPLRQATDTVRRLAAGDHTARAAPRGPAELRELSVSIDYLADESDRLRAGQEERARLDALVRQTAVRVREHLDAGSVIREAVTAIAENLDCDHVWVGQMSDGGLTLPEGNREEWGLRGVVIQDVPQDYVEFIERLYRQRSSFCLQDLRSEEAAVIPEEPRELLRSVGGVALLFVPFGIGTELLGEITLLRTEPGRPWTAAEISAVESLTSDLGRGLDHARMYEQEKELVGKLKAADQAKSDFLAVVSHDLRTPLTSIAGYAELLGGDAEQPLSDSQGQMLSAIERNTSRLRKRIDDLLIMSRIEMGTFESHLGPVDLAGVARAVVGEIRVTEPADGLDLQLAWPEQAVVVNGDAEQLDRAMANLVSNAVKYTPRGGRVDVSVRRDGDRAVAVVTDTGVGIPDADQASLFTRFYRASNVADGSFPGTGLGLAIVRTIIDNHDGEVILRSREGEGTTVTIRLPLAPEAATDAEPPRPAAPAAVPVTPAHQHDAP